MSQFREGAKERLGVVSTLLLDTLIAITAVVVRWLLLKLIGWLSPEAERGFAVTWLERVTDVGLVATAVIFFIFDLAKIVVRSYQSLRRTIKGEAA
jgi:hypothetical protein